ncbi:MAG: M36 family metallopeptidase [Parvularculaceae bacterium]|nr:M36 family metallopeptidase [Parvularculaceae bacterium]
MTTGLIRTLCGGSVAALALVAGGVAAGGPLNLDESGVYANRADLSRATRSTAQASVAEFLSAKGKTRGVTGALVETAAFKRDDGVSFARFEQRAGGLRIYGSYVKAAFGKTGELIHVIERTTDASLPVGAASIDEAAALRLAVGANFGNQPTPFAGEVNGAITTFGKTPFFYRAPTVERVVIADAGLAEGFLVETWSASDNKLYHTLVSGRGDVVSNELRTNEDSYNVFADHPGVSTQGVVSGPGAGNTQSPSGWLSGTQSTILIQGNNVRAYLDRNNNNAPDTGGVSVTDGNFLTAANLADAPTTVQNQAVAVQNLFWLNNIIHDELRRHGFNEAAGNFQENNFGLGGAGSDSVDAEAQDGGGTNNANFATPSDGSNPRMQMYIWTAPNPDRDGDLDSDIVWHEYGHGLTWRMIGSMSGNVPGAIGEGMGDVLAIIQNNQDAVGEYSFNNTNGIRSSRYGVHQDTIGDFNSTRGVHRNGEIIAATIWDMWQGYQAAGKSRDNIMSDIVGGMNFIPAAPTYFQMRDGFLSQAPADRDCLIWEAFAARGMGEGGSMNSTGSSVTESFSLPAACGGTPPPPPAGPRLTNLTGFGTNTSSQRWRATMTATVDNGSGTPQSGVVVNITTSTGASGSCTTSTSGTCSASLSNLRRSSVASVTFTVTGLNGIAGASGTPRSVVVNRP